MCRSSPQQNHPLAWLADAERFGFDGVVWVAEVGWLCRGSQGRARVGDSADRSIQRSRTIVRNIRSSRLSGKAAEKPWVSALARTVDAVPIGTTFRTDRYTLAPHEESLLPQPRHDVPVRKLSFAFDESIPNHWIDDNAFATHVFNGLNLVFPDGERFFIDAVRDRLRPDLDPGLRKQVMGFIGQEARHAHEHERYFDTLRAQGYRIDTFLRRFRSFARFTTRWLPAPLRLSMTAGAEHWTATLGAAALHPGMLHNLHPTMERLILWHALEEIEHKNVAYDVLQATHPSYLLRIVGYLLATVVLFGWSGFATRMLLRQERLSQTEIAQQRRRMRAQEKPEVVRTVRQSALAYFRRDFHPSQIDDLPLAHSRLADIEPLDERVAPAVA